MMYSPQIQKERAANATARHFLWLDRHVHVHVQMYIQMYISSQVLVIINIVLVSIQNSYSV